MFDFCHDDLGDTFGLYIGGLNIHFFTFRGEYYKMYNLLLLSVVLTVCLFSIDALDRPGRAAIWDPFLHHNKEGTRSTGAHYTTRTIDADALRTMIEDSSKNVEVLVFLRGQEVEGDVVNVLDINGVKECIRTAPSSEILSSVYASERGSVVDVIQQSRTMQNAKSISLEELTRVFDQDPTLLANGRVDSFSISISGNEDFAPLLKLSETQNILVVAVDDSSLQPPHKKAQYSRRLSESSSSSSNQGFSIYYDEKYLLVTPDIVTGVMTGLFFLAVGVLGLCCLGDIQGPGSFVNQNPTVGKEA
jgi:hypothetical protein